MAPRDSEGRSAADVLIEDLLRRFSAEGELAVFDPSILTNDPYAIIVAAFDVNGRGYIQPTVVYVELFAAPVAFLAK